MCEPATATLIVGALSAGATAYAADASKPRSPQVQQAPIDNTMPEAEAKSGADSAQRKRQLRAASLLATTGAGDINNPVTGTPSAKPLLGS